MQALLSYFIFCHLIAGGLMVFSAITMGFLNEADDDTDDSVSTGRERKKQTIWLCAKRCACKGLCTSVENKTLLKTVFVWNVVLCTCMNEYIYSTDNFSNQAVFDFKTHQTLKKALKNDRPKQTSTYQVIFVTLFRNKSQAHGVTITD